MIIEYDKQKVIPFLRQDKVMTYDTWLWYTDRVIPVSQCFAGNQTLIVTLKVWSLEAILI